MNENHRKLIFYNIDKLTSECDFHIIMEGCIQKNIITPTMKKIIEQDFGPDEHRMSEGLFQKITHRGPKAYALLLDILKENDYSESLKALSASTVPSATFNNEDVVIDRDNTFLSIGETTKQLNRTISVSPPSTEENGNSEEVVDTAEDGCVGSKPRQVKLEPYTAKTSFQFDSITEVKRATDFGTHPKLGVYKMKSKKRGVFFFVNIIKFKRENTYRNGADKDRENLVTLFSEMNFTVFYYENLTFSEFNYLMRKLIESSYFKNADSFFFCIQTHGDLFNNLTIMEFSDGLTMRVEDVILMFSNVNCKDLYGKPKVFFFPFCRGKISDVEKKIPAVRIETDGVPTEYAPSYSDILICYGTVPGFQTHRDTNFGSWYVRELCKIFAEHACDCHLEEMLKMVGNKTLSIRDAGRLQVASTENRGFYKLLFFNPKISD